MLERLNNRARGAELSEMSNLLPNSFRVVDAFRANRAGLSAIWSLREDGRLRQLYPGAPWSKLRSAFPTRSKLAIQQRAAKLSIVRNANRKPHWTGKEEALLRTSFSSASWPALEIALPRHTRSAIRQRATALRLARAPRSKMQPRYSFLRLLVRHRRQARITRLELAEIIGVSLTQLARWELGLNVPRLPMVLDWAQALGYSLELVAKSGMCGV